MYKYVLGNRPYEDILKKYNVTNPLSLPLYDEVYEKGYSDGSTVNPEEGSVKCAIRDFATYYKVAKKKIKLKLWSVEYAKGWLSCYLGMVLEVSEDNYNEYAKLIDELG